MALGIRLPFSRAQTSDLNFSFSRFSGPESAARASLSISTSYNASLRRCLSAACSESGSGEAERYERPGVLGVGVDRAVPELELVEKDALEGEGDESRSPA